MCFWKHKWETGIAYITPSRADYLGACSVYFICRLHCPTARWCLVMNDRGEVVSFFLVGPWLYAKLYLWKS